MIHITRLPCFLFLFSTLLLSSCGQSGQQSNNPSMLSASPKIISNFDSDYKTIHIFVALCDNENQGIVPVPSHLGNGSDLRGNLYWGSAYGIRTYFRRSDEWKHIKDYKVNNTILQRSIFQHRQAKYFLVADAYDGAFMKRTVEDFLQASAGLHKDTIEVNNEVIGTTGNSDLVAFIGHNGLMDFELEKAYKNQDNKKRDAIILACHSRSYFTEPLQQANSNPLLWTTGLMAPEAYTIHDALSAYIKGESRSEIRERAAKAYHKYQKCGLRGARNLLVTGH